MIQPSIVSRVSDMMDNPSIHSYLKHAQYWRIIGEFSRSFEKSETLDNIDR